MFLGVRTIQIKR